MCGVLGAVGEVFYDKEKHLREGEEVPSREQSKQRLERYLEDSLAGKENARCAAWRPRSTN